MDEFCEVTFTGDQGGTYYVACPLVQYISEDGMVNSGNSTIYLYTSPQQSNNSYAISIPAFSYPRYSSGYGTVYITNATNVSFNNRSHYFRESEYVEIILLTLLASISLIRLLLPRR